MTILSKSQRQKDSDSLTSSIHAIFRKAKEIPTLATGLQYVLRTVVMPSDLVESSNDKGIFKVACREALDVLQTADIA